MPNIAGTALNEKVTIKYTRPSRNNKFQRSDRVPPYENRYSATLVNTNMVKSKAIAMTEGQDQKYRMLAKVLTGEKRGLQKFDVELQDDA